VPDRARFVIHIALLLLITLLARPASAYVLSPNVVQSNTAVPQLSAPAQSREGYFVLRLSEAPTQNLMVEYSTDESFQKVERRYPWFGDFQSMTLTGFGDGNHYFRLITGSNETAAGSEQHTQLSNVVLVQVDHYSLTHALILFGFGGVLFVILVVIILQQHRRSQEHD